MIIKARSLVSFQILAALLSGLALGIASILLSPLWVLAGLAVLGFTFIVLKRPEIGLLGYLVITSTILDQGSLPRLSIGVGKLLITDIILMALFGLMLARMLVERGFSFVHTPVDIPLLAFVGIGFISTFLAIYRSSITFNDSLGEVRTVMSYLTFFVTTNLVREDRQLRTLLKGLALLAIVVAVATVAQFVVGSSIHILPGRVETLGTEGVAFNDVTRVIPPGQSVMMVALIAIFAILALQHVRQPSTPKILLCGLLGVAIILTFFRASWVVIAMAVLYIVYVTNGEQRTKLFLWALGAVLLSSAILIVVMSQPESRGAKLAQASLARLESLTSADTYQDPNSSLRWRDFEYSFAVPQILAHPLLGLGLGAMYRPLTPKDDAAFDGRTFIHNGHLYILLKTGIFAYLGLLAFLVGVLIRGLRNWRRVPDAYLGAIVLAFALASLGALIVSIVEPYLMTTSWTPLMGIVAGINEVILRGFSTKRSLVQ